MDLTAWPTLNSDDALTRKIQLKAYGRLNIRYLQSEHLNPLVQTEKEQPKRIINSDQSCIAIYRFASKPTTTQENRLYQELITHMS